MTDAADDRIHVIPLPHDEQRTVNAILVEGRPLTLVDTGLGHAASLAALQTALGRLGYHLRDIEQIVITHAHLDHFGAAAAIVAASGARVLGDAGGLNEMADFHTAFEGAQHYRLGLFRQAGAPETLIEASRRWGAHYATLGEPIRVDRGLAPGDRVTMADTDWQVIAVPGHAASSIALYQSEDRQLMSGDILVGIGAANVTLHRSGDGRLPAGWQVTIIESLERLAQLPLECVYPGHGARIDQPLAIIADRQRRTEARLQQVVGLLQAGPLTAFEICQQLYQPPVSTSSLGLSQAIGYVDALEMRGEAVATELDGRRRYHVRTG